MIEGSSIGPSSWKNNTVRGIKMSQNIIQRSDKSCDIGRSTDPLPHLRDTLAELSNDEAHRYFREVRSVVARLRESLLETNEEIKSLTRGKEALEKSLEHRRKDLSLNRESSDIRLSRPARERVSTATVSIKYTSRYFITFWLIFTSVLCKLDSYLVGVTRDWSNSMDHQIN